MASEKITPEYIADLLSQPSTEGQTALLHTSGLLNADGLSELLEFAGDLVHNDPGQARQLAMLCVEAAEAGNAPSIVPPAMYLRAQTHAIDGEFSEAGDLIRSARALYLSLGQAGAALRTNVGLISVLAEAGQYQEAITVGRSTLETIERNDQHGLTTVNARRLSALIQKNLGICYELIGDYVQALDALSQAEALFQEAGMEEESAALAMSRGSILLNLGRGVESVSALQEAAAIFSSMDNPLRRARCLNNLGNAHLLLGNYGQSLQALDEARRLLSTLDARADQLILQGLTADVYLVLNLYQEAAAEYRAANDGLKETGMAYQRAWVLWGLGAALTAQSQWEAADAALSEAAALFREAGNKQLL
jgi:tetratricopeptide (TPR) repeat protein